MRSLPTITHIHAPKVKGHLFARMRISTHAIFHWSKVEVSAEGL